MKKAFVVVGLGFGDEGKGTTVDYLTEKHKATLIVKSNGGPQAAHNVHTPNGKHHVFSQIGSGAFHGADTYISKYMAFDPLSFKKEYDSLNNTTSTVHVHESCSIITPFHVMANQIKETNSPNGSCGMGHGECMAMSLNKNSPKLYFKDLRDVKKTLDLLWEIRTYTMMHTNHNKDTYDLIKFYSDIDLIDLSMRMNSIYNILILNVLTDKFESLLLDSHDVVIFESNQGVLLDEWHGFNPHTTWSTTTGDNALQIIEDYGDEVETEIWGVIRSFSTRHGKGPFPAENSSFSHLVHDDDNCMDEWQGEFRPGYFDYVMFLYALSLVDVDKLMLTHYDKTDNGKIKQCFNYDLFNVPRSDKEKFFRLDNIGTFLKNNENKTLAYSEKLTKVLYKCDVDKVFEEDLIEKIQDFTQLPIVVSTGKTYLDKKEIN